MGYICVLILFLVVNNVNEGTYPSTIYSVNSVNSVNKVENSSI